MHTPSGWWRSRKTSQFVISVFFLSYRCVNFVLTAIRRLCQVVKAIHTGLWLGLIPDRLGKKLNDMWYAGSTWYNHDAFNLKGLFFNEAAMVERHFKGAQRILVGGAGGGREMLHLHRLGYSVEGFECNATLVEYANRILASHGAPASVVHTEEDHCIRGTTPYDGILIGWGVYIHMIGRATRLTFLHEVCEVLGEQGVLIIGYCQREPSASFFRTAYRVAKPLRKILYRSEVEEGDKLEPTLEHHFTREEICDELALAGLTVVDLDASIPGRALIVAARAESAT